MIATYSMDELSIARLEKLTEWLRLPGKSATLRYLIDQEYLDLLPTHENDDDAE